MGAVCSFSSIRLYKPSSQQEEEEEEEELLPPHLVLSIQRWLRLVQEQCKPGIDELELNPHAGGAPADDLDEVLSMGSNKDKEDPEGAARRRERCDSLSITNIQHHQRLLHQQDRASGGAPIDGTFKIVSTASRPRPSATPTSPGNPPPRVRECDSSVAPSVGTEMMVTLPSGTSFSGNYGNSRQNSSTQAEPCLSPGPVRVAVKRGHGLVASEDPAPASLQPPRLTSDVDVDEVAS